VHVTAAYAGVVYGEEDIVGGLEGWSGLFFEDYIVGFVEDEGEVLGSVSYGKGAGGVLW
jgi:hypothetical protein